MTKVRYEGLVGGRQLELCGAVCRGRYCSCEFVDERTYFLFCSTTQKRGPFTSRSPSSPKSERWDMRRSLDLLLIAVHDPN